MAKDCEVLDCQRMAVKHVFFIRLFYFEIGK